MMNKDIPGIEYFTSNPKGHLLERHIRNNFPGFYEELMKYPGDLKFAERVYWYFHNIHEKPLCPICGVGHPKFISFTSGYLKYCSYKCMNRSEDRMERIKETMLKRYGVENASQSQDIKEKKKQTLQSHYGEGIEVPLQSPEVREKMKQTTFQRYGVENASQSQGIKEKKKVTSLEHYGVEYVMQSPEVQNKRKQTTFQRYGVENASQSPQVKEKYRNTCKERYGVENVFQSPQVKEKILETTLEHHGVERPLQSPTIMAQLKQTNMERYGVDNTFQLPEAKKKAKQTLWNDVKRRHPGVLDIWNEEGVVLYKCTCPHDHTTCGMECDGIYEVPGIVFNNRLFHKTEPCTKLLPLDNHHNSGGTLELFIRDILESYNIPHKTNNRSLLGGKEVDIYIPDHNLAVGCNGVYWHSLKEPGYHHGKWVGCRNHGVQLLTLWEDQILNKPDIVRNILLSHLGIYDHKIGARQCDLHTVSSKDSLTFLQQWHLQGPVTGSVRLGLYYKDELVALMVFGRKRTALGNRKHDTWELYRYCCRGGWNVMGGASRLFKYFLTDHPDTEVESFSSNDISDGGLYRTLGFEKAGDQTYSYWYIDRMMQRHHRYDYRKTVLVEKYGADPTLTEFEITDSMGLLRIYDSGQQKWIYKT